MEEMLQKETIIGAFEQEKLNVEITENKKGQVVVSRMCELYKNQVFSQDVPWDDGVEQALKDKVTLLVKPALRKMIVQEQLHGKAIKPIITLQGLCPSAIPLPLTWCFCSVWNRAIGRCWRIPCS